MKKRNVVLHTAIAAAVLAMAGAASAGTLTGSTTFASEVFGAGSTTLALRPTVLTYTFSTPGGIVLNPGGAVNVYVRLSGGATLAAGAPAAGVTAGSVVAGLGLTPTVSAVSTDGTTFVVTLTNGTAGNITIGVGSTLTWAPAAGAVITNTSAGSVSVQGSASVLAANLNAVALPADVDGGVSNVLVWTSTAEAITSALAASSAFPFNAAGVAETTRIDLTVASAGSRFTNAAPFPNANAASTTIVNLGGFRFSETAGTQALVDGATDYTLAGRSTAATFAGTVVGSFKTGSTATVATDVTCTAGVGVLSTGTLNAGLTTFTWTGGTLPTAGTNYYVCMTVPATVGAIPMTAPTANFTFTKTAATDVADSVAGTLYNLQQNGATVTVRNYMPASFAPGFSQVVRLINTGASTAQVSVAVADDATGVTGASALIGSPVAPGGVLRLSQAQIEAAVGAVANTARPRLVFTAPTSSMEAQSLMLSNGVYTNLSSIE